MSQVDVAPKTRIAYAVKQLHHLLRSVTDSALADRDLSMAQFTTLTVLVDSEGLSPAELARRCSITRQSMQDVLKCLHTRRLIEKIAHPERGRTALIRVTDTGARLTREVEPAVREIERHMTRSLTLSQQEQLLSWLLRCVDDLGDPAPHTSSATA